MSVSRDKAVQWSSKDDALLRDLAIAEEKLETIASKLQRSAGSVRVRAYRLNISLGKSGKLMNHPAWLELSSDRMSFVVLDDRANVVKKIFELSAAGLGSYSIAGRLNSSGLKTFGSAQKWDQSAIDHILTNPAVTGRRTSKSRSDDETREIKQITEDYYPKVIQSDLFYLAQQARKNNLIFGRGRKGAMVTNLFTNTLTCAYCSSAIVFQNNNNSKSFICSSARDHDICIRASWSYDDFERSFFKFIENVEVEKLSKRTDQETITKLKGLAEQIFTYDARLDLSLFLKGSVSELQLACAGLYQKHESKPLLDAGGTRFFQVRFHGGAVHRWSQASDRRPH